MRSFQSERSRKSYDYKVKVTLLNSRLISVDTKIDDLSNRKEYVSGKSNMFNGTRRYCL